MSAPIDQRKTTTEQIIEFIQNNQKYTKTDIILDENGEIENSWKILNEIASNRRTPKLIKKRSRYLYELANRSFW